MTGVELKRIKSICEIVDVKDIGDLSDGCHYQNCMRKRNNNESKRIN